MCAGPMGASTLDRRRGGVSQGAGVVDRGHCVLKPCVVYEKDGVVVGCVSLDFLWHK